MDKRKSTKQIPSVLILTIILVVYAGGVVFVEHYCHSTAVIVCLGLVGIAVSWVLSNYMSLRPMEDLLLKIKRHHAGVDPDLPQDDMVKLTADITREFNQLNGQIARYINKASSSRGKIKQSVWNHTKDLRIECKQLKKHAHTDALTGLANRGYLDEHADKMVAAASVSEGKLACIMIDVDKFKAINDTFGHAVGDDLIVFTAEILKSCIRGEDFCARYGGDEFVVLLPGCTKELAQKVAERMRGHFGREVRNLIINSIRGMKDRDYEMGSDQVKELEKNLPSLSIGVATLQDSRVSNAAGLQKNADTALYHAKEGGRNCVVTF